jgi:cyclase
VNFVELRDAGDPVEIARRYDAQGADELTFLDITASSDDRDLILSCHRSGRRVKCSSRSRSVAVCAAVEDVRRLLNAGADKISINTAALAGSGPHRRSRRALSVSQCIVVAIDATARTAAGAMAGLHPRRASRHRALDAVAVGRSKRRGAAPARSC